MTTAQNWAAILAAQGIAEAEIDAARNSADAIAQKIHDLPSDPTRSIDPVSHQAVLQSLTEQAPAEGAGTGAGTGAGPGSATGSASATPVPQDHGLPETIEDMARSLQAGEITAVELAERAAARLEACHTALNAVARLEMERALTQAKAADAQFAALRRSGETPSPLLGIPVAHKDLYARAECLMEAGGTILKGHIASQTAASIQALDRAGAVDMGRVNTVEFALGPDGRNIHTGAIRNPWQPAHVTGGSSSGSGAAVGFGAVPAALGSDTGGSVRLPAAACGVVGVKPTAGLIGRSGIFPLSGSLDTAGPLTGCVRDAAVMIQAMTGPDPLDPQSVARPATDLLAMLEDGLGTLRIGLAETPFFDPVTDEIAQAVEAAAGLAAAEGAALSRIEMPGIADANIRTIAITNTEGAAQHRTWMARRAQEYGRETLGRLMSGLFIPGITYATASAGRALLLRHLLDTVFRDVDLVMTPVWPCDPPRIEGDDAGSYHQRVQLLGHCTRPVNYLGLPAVVLPCAVSAAGLPIAVQFIGRPFEEALLLRAARGYERARAFRAEHSPVSRA
ncbi:MAG: amidase [Pseudomonadota bacterium]